jgi:glycosyltransferase involved in cell wall biosynthesis
MNNPLISLIIPMYNSEKFIAECLNSVMGQTYKSLEIIIVDDNSTDNSTEIVKAYANKYKNITYVKTKNGNAAKTRRDGLKKSTADLVCFVDSDDVLDEKYVERLYQAMEATQTSLSACNMETFSGEFTPIKISKKSKARAIDSNASSFANHYHVSATNKLTLQTLPCKLFKKDLFDDIDYTVLVTNIFEDNFIMAQILRKVKKIGVIDEALYWYRQSDGTTSNKTITTKVEYNGEQLNFVEFFQDVVAEYCRKTLNGPDVDAAIDRLRATEFFNYARMVPDLVTHNEYLEQKIELEQKQAKAELSAKEQQIADIVGSRSYKVGLAVTRPISKVVNIIKKNRG